MRNLSFHSTQSFPMLAIIGLVIAGIMMFPDLALAGTGGSEFNTLTDWIKGLIGGSLGRLIAFVALMIGAIYGASKMNAMPMGLAFLIAIMIAFSVPIIENIVTATI
jgi:conjugal transfer pilus assembly protein TraA